MVDQLTPIHAIQGAGLLSAFARTAVRTRGVVTGHSRKGYFIQDPAGSKDPYCSDGIFVYSPRRKAPVGVLLEVTGEVADFTRGDNGRPTTQIKEAAVHVLSEDGPLIEPHWMTAQGLPDDPTLLSRTLNGLEGMLVGIAAGATFAAPSNPFGDYVCLLPGTGGITGSHGGVLVDPDNPGRWLPGFRILDHRRAPRLNVGARLLTSVVGPLAYRSGAFQIVARAGMKVSDSSVVQGRASFGPAPERTSILTLNGFNLDVRLEDPRKVSDPDRDVDDDRGDGRFVLLAKAIVEHAGGPDIVALQEVQDNDGAELSATVDASATWRQLIEDVRRLGGPAYRWADVPPEPDADGGQPGGNIRNGFLYNPARVELRRKTLRRIGAQEPAFAGSRKPLLARFTVLASGAELVVVNVHLASKRHQHSVFAPQDPGHDPQEATRVRQAELIREALGDVRADGQDFYVTGDFNDFEFSPTLAALCGDDCVNLVQTLPHEERFDYNHRGQLQVLMHGVVSAAAHRAGAVEYTILHGNELCGVQPGTLSGKATDHAYVLARIEVGAAGRSAP